MTEASYTLEIKRHKESGAVLVTSREFPGLLVAKMTEVAALADVPRAIAELAPPHKPSQE